MIIQMNLDQQIEDLSYKMNFNYNLRRNSQLNSDLVTHYLPYTTQKIRLMVYSIRKALASVYFQKFVFA